MSAFEQAVSDGLRTTFMSTTLPIEANPFLQAIKDDPRFLAAQAEMEMQVRRMRDRALAAEARGTLDELRKLAKSPDDLQI